MQKINLKNKTVFITGSAGFIGSNLVLELLRTQSPINIVGLDNMNDYYDVSIKEWRLAEIEKCAAKHTDSTYRFYKGDLSDKTVIDRIFADHKPAVVVNLGAQAGVRYSITNPDAYIQSNMIGFYNILEACTYKQQNPNLKVIVTGCLAERYRSQIEEEIPEVDAVVGCASNKAIDTIVERLFHGENHLESYGAKKDFPLGGKRVIGTPAHYAYLKIAEGCNNRCHYCAIPGIRGPLHSRDMADCVAEARWLAGEGVKELIVVAQDPTAYGEDWGKPGSICELLDKLNKVPGLEWIRIMYAYPERITDEFIAAMKRNEKVVPYLDLPIQHCNDTILKNMNRRSTRAELLEVIGKLRREIPGITLRTTLIAGFPGETEEQFEDLCNFVKEVQFDRLGCFAYSAEENTVAARMDGQIEQEVKDKRAELVMQIQTGIMAQKQAEKVGQTVHVLCDGIDEENGLYLCRTTGDAPEVDGCVCVSSEEPLYPGQFYDVLVEDSDLYDLYGTVVK